MKLVIVPLALAELQDAAVFYAERANVELGLAFVTEFERTANLILQNPKLGAIYLGTRRRYLLRRFPYCIIYQITAEELRVIAVAHSGGGLVTGRDASSESLSFRCRKTPYSLLATDTRCAVLPSQTLA